PAMFAAVFGVVAGAERPQPNSAPAQGAATFRSGTRLTVETVSVKDKNGLPIEGLTAKDFAITEDGDPQVISFVEFQRVQVAPGSASDQPPVTGGAANLSDRLSAANTVSPAPQLQISSSLTGGIRATQ